MREHGRADRNASQRFPWRLLYIFLFAETATDEEFGEAFVSYFVYGGLDTHAHTLSGVDTLTVRGDDDRMYHIRFSDRNLSNDCVLNEGKGGI